VSDSAIPLQAVCKRRETLQGVIRILPVNLIPSPAFFTQFIAVLEAFGPTTLRNREVGFFS
jgi:hypothetical protein